MQYKVGKKVTVDKLFLYAAWKARSHKDAIKKLGYAFVPLKEHKYIGKTRPHGCDPKDFIPLTMSKHARPVLRKFFQILYYCSLS